MKYSFYLLVALIFFSQKVSAQEHLFSYNGIYSAPPSEKITRATRLKIDRLVLARLYDQQKEEVRIKLPVENTFVILSLKKANLFAKGFRLTESNSFSNLNYTEGYHLQGSIEGEESSLVALSIFSDFAAGIISYRGQNYNLAVANNQNDHTSNDYVIYADEDFKAPENICYTLDDSSQPVLLNREMHSSSFVGCPVDIYFETGYKMMQTLGSEQAIMNYLTILFNCMQTLYHNENVQVQIREVLIWNSPEPEYSLTTTQAAIQSMRSRIGMSGFNGDLAHYVTFTQLGGGIAALDGLCNWGAGGRCAVSGSLLTNYAAFPNYSFTVNVITHETGHNIGSNHTHNCSWPGGAIDNCYATEGGCSPGPAPVNGGTVMSYCHLTSSRINFANGFGPLPGDRIRQKVIDASSASCICDCSSLEVDVITQDIACGYPTGSARVAITGGTGPFSYAWSNGTTDSVAASLSPGTYYVTVTGSTPECKVVKGFKILNSGSATIVSVDPPVTSVTKCLNESYTINAAVSPSGAYTYQWFDQNGAIAGATNSTYTISSSVVSSSSYYVVATGGTCNGQSPAVAVSFQPVTVPSITFAGSLEICDGAAVMLNSNSTSLVTEWLRNNVPIAGATAVSYQVTTPGSYTVRHFSPSNLACSAVSPPVVVSVKPRPGAVVSPASLEFCEGSAGTLLHDSLPGETFIWYKNAVPVPQEFNATLPVNSSGSYTLKVTGANGCSSVSTASVVTAHANPNATLVPSGNVLLCDGGTVAIVAPSFNNANYSWFNGEEGLTHSTHKLIVAESGTYHVKVLNTLTGCEGLSAPTHVTIVPPPSVFAGNDTLVATGQPIRLHAVSSSTSPPDRFEWTPSTGLDNAFSQSPVARLQSEQLYTVKAIYPSGCAAYDDVLIKVLKGPAIYVPSAFTPNGDGLNDVLKCTAIGLKSFDFFAVYNRFGQRIFYTKDLMQCWDGKWKGMPVETSSFIFIAEGLEYNGRKITSKGTVTVIR